MIAERERSAACGYIYVFSRSSHCGPNGVQAHKPCNQTSRNHNGGGRGGGGVAQSPADAVKSRAPRPAGEYPDPRGAPTSRLGLSRGEGGNRQTPAGRIGYSFMFPGEIRNRILNFKVLLSVNYFCSPTCLL